MTTTPKTRRSLGLAVCIADRHYQMEELVGGDVGYYKTLDGKYRIARARRSWEVAVEGETRSGHARSRQVYRTLLGARCELALRRDYDAGWVSDGHYSRALRKVPEARRGPDAGPS